MSATRLVVCAILICSWFSVANAKEIYFQSKGGFSVRYPDTWVRLKGATDRLDILSTHHRVEGAVIPHGGAEIIVSEISLGVGEALPSFLKRSYDVDVISQRRVSTPARDGKTCGILEKVDATFEIAPDPKGIQRQTFFLCRIGHRSFLTSLTRWNSDSPNPNWERTALRIASSLRLRPPGRKSSD